MGQIIVGIADMKVGSGSDELVTYALGSCIGVCMMKQCRQEVCFMQCFPNLAYVQTWQIHINMLIQELYSFTGFYAGVAQELEGLRQN